MYIRMYCMYLYVYMCVYLSCCIVFIDDSAGDMVSPQKTRQQVEAEDAVGKDLYKKSHNDYDVGEVAL